MPGKEQIVEELGDLLLPNLVNQALVANDRAKYYMTLLQTSREHAEHPETRVSNLKTERTTCGIPEETLDTVVERSRKTADGNYYVPNVARVHEAIVENLRSMLAPIQSFMRSRQTDQTDEVNYAQRLESLTAEAPDFEEDLISSAYIDLVTSAQPADGDSFHLLVMNLHKELNQLQQQIASEFIDGASVYGVTDADRPLIAAFMLGVNRTRALKFDHPGLETTATRADDALIIQNDIGTTDAHVLVIHITSSETTVTYTDVHLQRLLFFQSMLNRFPVKWEDTRSRRSARFTEALYHLSIGRYASNQENSLADYLEFLGSRIVFLIDWNRARKRLRKLAPKKVGLEVLQWAAANDLGHMGFLKAGGEQLVFDALQLSSRVSLQIGRQLSDIIGVEQATEFLKFTLKTATEGFLSGHSELLIRDRVQAELSRYLDSAHQSLLELVSEHATIVVELATAARDCLLLPSSEDPQYLPRTAARAKKWEHLADDLVSKARVARGERGESKAAAELLRIADDAADELEEGIFLLTLLEGHSAEGSALISGDSREVLQSLAGVLVPTAQEYLKTVENARQIVPGSPREEVEDFLNAVDDVISLEHQTDDSHRRTKASILSFTGDFKQLHLFTSIADNLESASDAMMRAALMLRDYILGVVLTR